MKKVIVMTMLSLALVSGAAMAREGGGSGSNLRMAPFSGDVNKATPQEQQSIYYTLAKVQADAKAAKLAKQAEATK